jgi:hypothetical protein
MDTSDPGCAPLRLERDAAIPAVPALEVWDPELASVDSDEQAGPPVSRLKLLVVPLAISLLVLPFLLEHLGTMPFNDTEVPYALVAREMRATGDWVMPTLLGIPRLDKPPMMYWLVAVGQRMLGEGEGVARHWTVLATWGILLILWAMARDMGQPAWLAPLIFGFSLGPQLFGRQLFLDPVMMLWMALSFLAYERARRGSPRWGVVFYAALGLAALTKGAVAVGLPCLTVLLHMAITRERPSIFRGWRLAAGGALCLGVALPWYVLMTLRRPDFPYYFLLREHVLRFTGQRYPPDEFLPVVPFLAMTWAWTIPWAGLVPLALWRALRRESWRDLRSSPELLPVIWAGVVLAVFSLSRSRVEYYALPALPALALIVARLWEEAFQPEAVDLRQKMRWCLALSGVAFFGLALGAELFLGHRPAVLIDVGKSWWAPGWPHDRGAALAVLSQIHWRAVVTLSCAATLFGLAALLVRRWPRLTMSVIVILMAPFLLLSHWGFALIEPFQSHHPTARLVRQLATPGTLVILEEPHEFMWIAGIAYYGGPAARYVVASHPGSMVRHEPADRFLSDEAIRMRWLGKARTLAVTGWNTPLMSELLGLGGRVAGQTAQEVVLENHE